LIQYYTIFYQQLQRSLAEEYADGLSIGAKHSKLKGLLNSISIADSDNPLAEVEYKGKQSNVILTTQGESTLKIFGD